MLILLVRIWGIHEEINVIVEKCDLQTFVNLEVLDIPESVKNLSGIIMCVRVCVRACERERESEHENRKPQQAGGMKFGMWCSHGPYTKTADLYYFLSQSVNGNVIVCVNTITEKRNDLLRIKFGMWPFHENRVYISLSTVVQNLSAESLPVCVCERER